MKCLILAAGKGERISQISKSKPLTHICGTPLIEHVITSAHQAGVTEFIVVLGFQGELVKKFLKTLADKKKLDMTCINNVDWKKGNATSVYAAKTHIKKNFVLLMADHLFDSQIVTNLIKNPINNEEIILAVDDDFQKGIIDLEDATKVWVQNGFIKNIGKKIKNFNAIDTGIFYCTPTIFETLGNCAQLSEGVQKLALKDRVKVMQLSGEYWIDVDTEKMLKQAEETLYLHNR